MNRERAECKEEVWKTESTEGRGTDVYSQVSINEPVAAAANQKQILLVLHGKLRTTAEDQRAHSLQRNQK